MSSVEFHEDEWGRHWSYSPALHGTRFRLNYPLFATLYRGLRALAQTIVQHYELQRTQAEILSRQHRSSDVYGRDEVVDVLYKPHEGVRDEFGRAVY